MTLNLAKCEGLWLGRSKYKQQTCNLSGIKWPQFLNKLGTNWYILDCNINNISSINALPSIPLFYQQMVVAFSKSINTGCNTDILNKPLFGNKLITYKKNKKAIIPYFINWINSEFKYVGDLKIINGKIDSQYIFDRITQKRNVYNEIAIVMKCLKSLIKDITHDPPEFKQHNPNWHEIYKI